MAIFPGVLRLALRGTFPDVATYELGNSYCAKCLNKDPIAKLAESTAERAQTQISCSETGYQQNCPEKRTNIWKRLVEETVKSKDRDLAENPSLAEQGCESWP